MGEREKLLNFSGKNHVIVLVKTNRGGKLSERKMIIGDESSEVTKTEGSASFPKDFLEFFFRLKK